MAEAGTGPELSVVCKSCGAEVSPYVTECPYCGTRLRKRAPKLERVGDEVRVREGRTERRARRAAERRARRADRLEGIGGRPLTTVAAILVPAVVLVVERATELSVFDLGAIVGPIDDDVWRYFAAPFVYDDVGYLFACALALAIFLPGVEARVGTFPTLLLVIGCGALGMLAADGMGDVLDDGVVLAAGGNGIALGALTCWYVLRDAERRIDPTVDYEWIGVAVAAAVLLFLPVIEDFADPWAGIAGGLVGAGCGFAAALGGRVRA
jgi:membrane associated rhomboid family serine protease